MQEMEEKQQAQLASVFGGGIGGAQTFQQAQNQSVQQNFFNPFALNPFMQADKAQPEHMKDAQRLEAYLIKMCLPFCQRRERSYHSDSELCMTKCFDSSFIYARTGLNELNQFAYENNIPSQ